MGGLAIIGVPAELAEDILELIVELHRLQSLQGCACSTMDCSDLVVSSFPCSLLLSIFCLLLNVFSQRYHKLIQLVQLWCAADLAGTMTDTGQSLTTSHRGHPSSSPLPKPCHLYPICHLPLLLSLHMQEKSIIIHRLKYCELYMEVYFPYIFNEFSCMTPYLQLPQD